MAASHPQTLSERLRSAHGPGSSLGSFPHPVFRLWLPRLTLPGMLRAMGETDTCGGFALSIGTPDDLDEAPNGAGEAIRHAMTGEPLAPLIRHVAESARDAGVVAQLEIEGLAISGEDRGPPADPRAARDAGANLRRVRRSVSHVRRAVEEALATGMAGAFSADCTALFEERQSSLPAIHIQREYRRVFSTRDQLALATRYLNRPFVVPVHGASTTLRYVFEEEDLMRAALRFRESLLRGREIFNAIRARTFSRPFGFEIVLDSDSQGPARETTEKDFIFYLNEWRAMGCRFDFAAPPMGLSERADHVGGTDELATRARRLAAIAQAWDGELSVRAMGGAGSLGVKARRGCEAVAGAARRRVKCGLAAPFFRAILGRLARRPAGSPARTLYEQIFDEVEAATRRAVLDKSASRADEWDALIRKYERDLLSGVRQRRDPRTRFFQSNASSAFQTVGSEPGRGLAGSLLRIYETDHAFQADVDSDVRRITVRFIECVGAERNLHRYAGLSTRPKGQAG